MLYYNRKLKTKLQENRQLQINKLFFEYKSAAKVAKQLNIRRNSVYRLLEKWRDKVCHFV